MVRRLRCMLVIVAMVLAAVGCGRRPERLPEGVTVPALRGKQGSAGRVAGLAKGRDEAFVPPVAAELDRLVWIDRPVKDGLAVLREELAAGEAGDERALAAPNDSPAANGRILAAIASHARPPSPHGSAQPQPDHAGHAGGV
jgi:hypothetical protein